MEEIILEVETITPLFIAGADQRNIENEGLRAPSLRGAMRWWFRAICGNYLGNNISNLIKAENEIFGSTSSKSKITLKTYNEASPEIIDNTYRSWEEAIIWDDYVDYFFFSCLDKRKDRITNRIKVKSRPYYPEGSKFTVILRGKKDELKVALASLWALIHLGGIGFRARRGAGCLKVKNVKGETFGLNFIFKTPEQLEKEIGENIEKSKNLISDLAYKERIC